jgi:hypothetical protein
MYYNDQEFAQVLEEKPGNVKLFRRIFTDHNKIHPREKFNDKHVELFQQIIKYKNETGAPWEKAIERGISMNIDTVQKIKFLSDFIIGTVGQLGKEVDYIVISKKSSNGREEFLGDYEGREEQFVPYLKENGWLKDNKIVIPRGLIGKVEDANEDGCDLLVNNTNFWVPWNKLNSDNSQEVV